MYRYYKEKFDVDLSFVHNQRSPDLSSSRDDDDAGYNSTKADEVNIYLLLFNINELTIFYNNFLLLLLQ